MDAPIPIPFSRKTRLIDVYLDDPSAPTPARWKRAALQGQPAASPIPAVPSAPTEPRPAAGPKPIAARAAGMATIVPASRVVKAEERQVNDERAKREAEFQKQVDALKRQLHEQQTALTEHRDKVAAQQARIEQQERELAQQKQEWTAVAATLENFSQAAQTFRSQQRRMLGEFQVAVKELAAAIASQLVHVKLDSGDIVLDGLVRDVIKRLETNEPVTVTLHPDDLALLKKHVGDDLSGVAGDSVRFIEDAALSRGSCIAHDGDVSVTSAVDEHLAELKRQLTAVH